jgi:adenine specific DNA methylase Mod
MSENLRLDNHDLSEIGADDPWLSRSELVASHDPLPRGDGGSTVASVPGNKLYFGDNLDVLRGKVKDESVDLIYLDPPFNSSATYNVLFRTHGGEASEAQAEAFRDTWEWGDSARDAYDDVIRANGDVALVVSGLRKWLGENAMMAYLVMMAARLIELRRVMKPTASLFLHCDPAASHYLKIILDAVFGHENFRNEIIWKRKSGRGETNAKSNRFGQQHDTLLFYSAGPSNVFNTQFNFDAAEGYIAERFKYTDEQGRRYRKSPMLSPKLRPNLIYDYKGYKSPEKGWAVSRELMEQMDREGKLVFPKDKTKRIERKQFLDEYKGQPVQSIWSDIPFINPMAQERLGYPTQKPLALLERIIAAASNEGDVILDPFCGCGTTIEASEKMKRQWIGIDVTHYAITLIEGRLHKIGVPLDSYVVGGRPTTVSEAHELARRDKHQFQWWASWRLGAQVYREEKRGADRGIDGNIFFHNGPYGVGRIIVSVKGGENVGVQMVRDLRGVIEREEAEMGVLITLPDSTGPMRSEAAAAGYVRKSAHGRLPRLQIVTLEDLFSEKYDLPPLPKPEQKVGTARRKEHPDQFELLLPFEGGAIKPAAGDFVDPRFDPRLLQAAE